MKLALVVVLLAAFMGQAPTVQVVKEANAFLTTLNPEQRSKALFALDSDQLYNWHFVPRSRPGLSWGEMTPSQQKAAHDLLKSGLSKVGYQKIEDIRSLEPVLKELEGGSPGRDERLYTFSIFGTPSNSAPWAWRYEGHHISLTFVYRDGRLVASTPQFLGSNPEQVLAGPKKGLRPLPKERDLAFKLLKTLGPDQLTKAKISSNTTGDIITGNDRKAAIEGNQGLPYGELTTAQKQLLMELLKAHAEVQSEKEQARRVKQIEDEELGNLVFAWMGATDGKGRHYYRIQGKNLIVEYDNSQGNGTHIHTVWRNKKEDFGADPLLDHYQNGHKH